jgi:predicted oxidoreductase (fatty acid repression mutant protein)
MQQSRAVLVTGDMHHKVWDSFTENYTKSFKDDGESILSTLFMRKGGTSVKRRNKMGAGA